MEMCVTSELANKKQYDPTAPKSAWGLIFGSLQVAIPAWPGGLGEPPRGGGTGAFCARGL